MTQLRRLTDDGRRLLDDDFFRGTGDAVAPEEIGRYSEPIDATADVDRLARKLETLRAEYPKHNSAIDPEAAVAVHKCVDVSRRIAGIPGMWHYLAAVEFPEFVRHRWEYTTESAMREKFLGAGKDIYSNALHRLWWVAELTYDEDAAADDADDEAVYERTRKALRNQTFANKVFDRWFARYRPAAVACSEELSGASSSVIEETTLRMNHVLTKLQLEGLSERRLRGIVRRIREDVESERELAESES